MLGLLALVAGVGQDFRTAFLWLFAAVIVDGTDGWLARRFRVAERLPTVDGSRLDDIVDYVTYVFVPAYLIQRAGLLPDRIGLVTVAAVLLASAYGFARTDAKTPDHFFTGFPSCWNVVALYLYLAEWPRWSNAAALGVLCLLVFVPSVYVYPSRTPVLRGITVTLAAIWGLLLLLLVWRLPERSPGWTAVSLAFPVYYGALSVVLSTRRARRPAGTPP